MVLVDIMKIVIAVLLYVVVRATCTSQEGMFVYTKPATTLGRSVGTVPRLVLRLPITQLCALNHSIYV